MVVKTQDVRTPCYSDIYNIINNYTNTNYLYTLLFAKLYAENVINKAFHKHAVASFTGAWVETINFFAFPDLLCRILYGFDTSLSQSVQIIIVSTHLGSSFHDQELLYKSIIINKIQTTTTKKYHYLSIDCSYVIYLF